MDIRGYIRQNFHDNNENDIREAINGAIEKKDEITLPGLGVFFETLWINSNQNEQNKILKIIKQNIQK